MNISVSPINLVEFISLGEEMNFAGNQHISAFKAKVEAPAETRLHYAGDVTAEAVATLQAISDEIESDDEWGEFTDPCGQA